MTISHQRFATHNTTHRPVGRSGESLFCMHQECTPETLIMPGARARLTHIWPSRWPEIERKKAPEIYLVMTAPPDKKTGQPDLFGAPPSEPQNDPQSAVLSITRPAALLIFVHTQYARLLFSFYLTHSRQAFHCQHFYCVSVFQIRLLFAASSNCSFCLITQTACTKHLHLPQNKHCRNC